MAGPRGDTALLSGGRRRGAVLLSLVLGSPALTWNAADPFVFLGADWTHLKEDEQADLP